MKKSTFMRFAALLLTAVLCIGTFSGCQLSAEPEYLPGEYVGEDYEAEVDAELAAALAETAAQMTGPLGDVTLTPVDEDMDQPDASPNVPGGSSGSPADGGSSGSDSGSAGSSTGSFTVGSPLPLHDIAVKSGSTNFVLRCTAPSGSTVTATVNGNSYTLKATKTVKTGTYVAYSAKYTMPSATGTADLGPIKYSVTYGSKKATATSKGSLFAVGTDATLRIMVKSTSTTGFASSSMNSGYVTILKKGAIDTVTDYKGDMYKLGTGMWVLASAVTPQTKNVAVNNPISSISYSPGSTQDKLTLAGDSHPVYKYSQTAESLTLTLYRTTGMGGINLGDSSIFSNVDVSESNGHTVLTFTQKESGRLWGFLVEYSGGTTTILFKRTPARGSDDQPFSNLTIAVDPGHGGNDRGAAGYGTTGSYEKDINWSTAQRLKTRLEGLGATVVMLRTGDNRVELTDRLAIAQESRVDFLISVHCNASATNASAKGVEVYYNDTTTSRNFAYYTSYYIAEKGERTDRGHKRSCFIITLNTYCPSILVEQGFVTNKSEFSDLNSEQGQKNTVEGIVSGINAMIK